MALLCCVLVAGCFSFVAGAEVESTVSKFLSQARSNVKSLQKLEPSLELPPLTSGKEELPKKEFPQAMAPPFEASFMDKFQLDPQSTSDVQLWISKDLVPFSQATSAIQLDAQQATAASSSSSTSSITEQAVHEEVAKSVADSRAKLHEIATQARQGAGGNATEDQIAVMNLEQRLTAFLERTSQAFSQHLQLQTDTLRDIRSLQEKQFQLTENLENISSTLEKAGLNDEDEGGACHPEETVRLFKTGRGAEYHDLCKEKKSAHGFVLLSAGTGSAVRKMTTALAGNNRFVALCCDETKKKKKKRSKK